MNTMISMGGIGIIELIMVVLMGGSSLSGLPLGMPPGQQDAALSRTPPDGCVVYVDWAARSEGKPGAAGIDGLVADMEVLAFADQVEHAFRAGFDANMTNPQERDAAHAGIDLALTLIQQPGCLFVSFDNADLPPREDFPNFAPLFERLKVGLVVQTGDDGDTVQEDLSKLFAVGGMELPAELDRFLLPVPVPGGGVTLHREENRLIACYGQGTLDTILAGLAADREGLLGDKRIMDALQDVAVDRPAQRVWIDFPGLITAADRIAGGQAMVVETLSPLGLDSISHYASTIGVDTASGQIISRTHVATDERRAGLLALFTGRPLTVDDFAHIPGDSDFYIGKSLNHRRILDAAQDIINAANPEVGAEVDAGLEQAEAVLEFSIRDDLMAGFGDVWTLYDSPANGGVLLSAPVLTLEVRDHQKASATFLRMMALLEGALDRELANDQDIGRRRRGVFLASHGFDVGGASHAIAFINTIGDEVPVAPAFCLTESHLLVGLHPQTIKGHLRYLTEQGERDQLDFPADHPLRTRSLMYFGRIDSAAALRYLVAVIPYFGQIAASEMQREGFKIDAFAIPSARGLLPYLSDSTSWIEVTADGITCGGTNGVPIPGIGGLQMLPMMLFGVRSQTVPMDLR